MKKGVYIKFKDIFNKNLIIKTYYKLGKVLLSKFLI